MTHDPIFAGESSSGRLVKIGGRWMKDAEFVISTERLQRQWAGYECASCFERLSEPFPEVCPLIGCGYRISENQIRDLERDYKGWDKEFSDLMEGKNEDHTETGLWLPS